MTYVNEDEKRKQPTGLRRGDASKIAGIHRVSVTHVLKVARGERVGRAALVETIDRYRQRSAAASMDATAAGC